MFKIQRYQKFPTIIRMSCIFSNNQLNRTNLSNLYTNNRDIFEGDRKQNFIKNKDFKQTQIICSGTNEQAEQKNIGRTQGMLGYLFVYDHFQKYKDQNAQNHQKNELTLKNP